MRITTKTLSRRLVSNLNYAYENMIDAQTRALYGKSFIKPSDDPISATRSMDIRNKITRSKQHGTNIDEAKSVFKAAETSLKAVTKSIKDIKTNLSKALNGSYNQEDKEVIAESIETMKENIISQLNSEYAGKYIFGGFNTFQRPFTEAGAVTSYNSVDLELITAAEYSDFMTESIIVQTGKATEMNTSIPGVSVTGYGPDNLISVLDDICTNLRDPAAPRSDLELLDDKVADYFTSVQNHISTIGTKVNNLENMQAQNESTIDNLEALLSRIEDIDFEEAFTEAKTAEMVYNAALSIGAKIIQPTLVDFLR